LKEAGLLVGAEDLHAEFFGFAHVDGHGRCVGVLSERLEGLMFWLEEKIIGN